LGGQTLQTLHFCLQHIAFAGHLGGVGKRIKRRMLGALGPRQSIAALGA
jgi:hypothetical protein